MRSRRGSNQRAFLAPFFVRLLSPTGNGESGRRASAVEVLVGQPTFTMGAVGHLDPLVVDEQVRMVIDRLGGKAETDDESDRFRKSCKSELPADDFAFNRPIRQVGHP